MTKPKPEFGEKNTFRIPRGENLRRAMVQVFREQRRAILHYLTTGRKLAQKDGHAAGPLPAAWPDWHDFGLGALEVSERMKPLLKLTWEQAAGKYAPRVGLDPDSWSVVNPRTERMIEEAALNFCASTNNTTSKSLDAALAETRKALVEGVVKEGESLEKLTKRIMAIFESASKSKARQIAQTETSRAVHAAQEQAAIASGVVTGWEWLLSADACPKCVAVYIRAPYVRLNHAFAVVGSNPHYSTVKYPPLHPHCNCSLNEVLDTDPQPAWSDTLHQPAPATEEEHDLAAVRQTELINSIFPGSKPKPPKPTPAVKPKPVAKPKPAPKPKPKPAPPPPAVKPTPVAPKKPAWKPGTPIEPGLPIGERIRLVGPPEVKLGAILRLQSDIDAVEARSRAATEAVMAYLASGGSDPKRLAELQVAFAKASEDYRKAKDAVQAQVDRILKVGPADRPTWKHLNAAGDWTAGSNAAVERKKGGEWLGNKLAAPGDAIHVNWESVPGIRAFANERQSSLGVAPEDRAHTHAHELGHHVEFRASGAKKAAFEFLDHRVGNEPLRPMSELCPLGKFDPGEMGRKDDWEKAFGSAAGYIGKDYRDNSGARVATEVISMGVEKLYTDPLGFAKSDPEYCKFILGILDGSLRSP